MIRIGELIEITQIIKIIRINKKALRKAGQGVLSSVPFTIHITCIYICIRHVIWYAFMLPVCSFLIPLCSSCLYKKR